MLSNSKTIVRRPDRATGGITEEERQKMKALSDLYRNITRRLEVQNALMREMLCECDKYLETLGNPPLTKMRKRIALIK